MDILDHLIELAQIEGEIHTHCLFQGDWQSLQPSAGQNMGVFHIIVRGECEVIVNKEKILLKAGDIFFLPEGDLHYIQSRKFAENTQTLIDKRQNGLFQVASNSVEKSDFEMFCGAFYYDKQSILFKILPHILHFSMYQTPIEQLVALFRIEAEGKAQFAGRSIINALSSVLFSYILRHYIEKHESKMGLLAVLQDKRLAVAVRAILQNPEKNWNMETLAEIANMSRANFIRVFQKKMDTTPGKFLSQVRMQQASMLLKTTQKNILTIALDIGYQSEAYFSRVFKQYYGISPNQYRKQGETDG
ncbi:AraC family transcriptional regulator [Avibacterium gallinarum]|uniref:AraC family transcriptional activator of mtrCDE n=1 Tax=Avibacterium gallinarum TaxID=755 RepID=A0A379AZ60_AVIGA|nr:AraC family transcriptional regulator [Avibacterium gallinarum]POY44735.1 AraC family transcriptional regulator [Avibacterium gallinarum]TDP30532.1 AraC family transcriptional activator of mtrCDE [Avibacterium gallinarum]SUB27032.1 HTH-type transcriptional regulator [Avibacterium gallinarum]